MIKTEEAFSLKCCNNADKFKVRKILKDSLDLIQSPSVKIQIIDGKICLRCKGKALLVGCQQTIVDIIQKFFALLPQVNFPANNLNFH